MDRIDDIMGKFHRHREVEVYLTTFDGEQHLRLHGWLKRNDVLIKTENILPLFASCLPFLCLIFAHLECPAIIIPLCLNLGLLYEVHLTVQKKPYLEHLSLNMKLFVFLGRLLHLE